MQSDNINDEILKYLNDQLAKPLRPGEPRHILIWYDEDGQNAEYLSDLASDNLEVIVYDDNPMFIENHIANLAPGVNVLVYSDKTHDNRETNPLIALEMRNPSGVFIPDEINLDINTLGLAQHHRSVVERNKRFFKNKARIDKIKTYLPDNPTSDELSYAFLATNFDADSIRKDRLLVAVFRSFMQNPTEFVKNLKFIDEEYLAGLLIDEFGDKSITFENFNTTFERIIISYFFSNLDGVNTIPRLRELILPKEFFANINMLVHDLLSDSSTASLYQEYAERIATKYNIAEILEQLELESYINADTFEVIDIAIIKKLLAKLDQNEPITEELHTRRTKNFCEKYHPDYKMLNYADKFFGSVKQNLLSIVESNRDRLVKLYTDKLYEIDTFYRKFNQAYQESTKSDDYLGLIEHIENTYVMEYCDRLAEKWCNSISGIEWDSGDTKLQQNFYDDNLRPLDAKKDRVFVIISDAMRYEVASELATKLRKSGADISLDSMIGVIPSYTQLGMAALLPHGKLTINDDSTVSSDDNSTAGTDNRNKILVTANENNLAVTYDDLPKRKSDWKTLFSGKKYVYIYHDVIDKVGESDDKMVFDACVRAIKELEQLVLELHTTFSGVNVILTSDHGFFYRNVDLDKIDEGTDAKKIKDRYSLSTTPGDPADNLSFKMSYLNPNDTRYINIPRGSMAYKKRGGTSNYIHGGAMPQEIIIPKLSFKSSRQTTTLPQVKILYNGISTKITNAITFLNFIQDNPVSEEKISATYKVYFEDADGNRISDEVTIIADSSDPDPAKREFKEKFVFSQNRTYDKNANYFLVITDGAGYEERINFKIDIIMSLL
ncbi:MAG: BREX-1 system phosphatase PglZ type A [Candidatus Saccharibacteria bacterium]|nr:BREX-1 system phosphatase PglZ type A [Candidatus Saccharibacteria bacterium]